MTGIMAHYIGRAVVTAHLEIPMLGRKPAVKDFDHLDWSLAKPETSGLLLATVARVALHFDDEITHRGSCASEKGIPWLDAGNRGLQST